MRNKRVSTATLVLATVLLAGCSDHAKLDDQRQSMQPIAAAQASASPTPVAPKQK